ncbi:PEGA domain-containing protein [Thiomicrospira microaerophila]|uniref:PEGA domain-containing protein n=1 Tax=Thiomicrospira microaerophila TaxID=406020 RepID=UPI0005C888F7|nr:PEGA domain-containing protein [Thiomicrospira microaerophila]
MPLANPAIQLQTATKPKNLYRQAIKGIGIALIGLALTGCNAEAQAQNNKIGDGFIASPTKLERPKADSATLRITSNVGGANIYINGHFRGETSSSTSESFDIRLAEGTYHIQLVKPIDANSEWRGERRNLMVVDL